MPVASAARVAAADLALGNQAPSAALRAAPVIGNAAGVWQDTVALNSQSVGGNHVRRTRHRDHLVIRQELRGRRRRPGIERANQTLENIKEAWIASQKVVVEDGKIVEYRVILNVTFVLR